MLISSQIAYFFILNDFGQNRSGLAKMAQCFFAANRVLNFDVYFYSAKVVKMHLCHKMKDREKYGDNQNELHARHAV